ERVQRAVVAVRVVLTRAVERALDRDLVNSEKWVGEVNRGKVDLTLDLYLLGRLSGQGGSNRRRSCARVAMEQEPGTTKQAGKADNHRYRDLQAMKQHVSQY